MTKPQYFYLECKCGRIFKSASQKETKCPICLSGKKEDTKHFFSENLVSVLGKKFTRHTELTEKTCAECGKKFLGSGHSKFCHAPCGSDEHERYIIVCQWCKKKVKASHRNEKWCAQCRLDQNMLIYGSIWIRITRLYFGDLEQKEVARLLKLGKDFRFKKPHEKLNTFYFGDKA